jgi:branched-subunit amino acid transport protein
MKMETFGIILGMAAVTFVPRFLPMALLTKWALPEKMKQGLDYMPTAILSAIVFPLLFFDSTSSSFMIKPQILLSALPVFVFSWRVRSVWGAVLLGMAIYWGLGFIL